MAVTSAYLMDTLKTFYAKEGVESLLLKNSPTLEKLKFTYIGGKDAEFPVMYSRSAGCGSNYLSVKNAVKESGRVKSFHITPGNLFAAEIFGQKELLASADLKGAYLPIAETKLFSSCEGYRKTASMALFGDGTGFIADLPKKDSSGTAITSIANGAEVTVTLPSHALMYIDLGSSLKIKAKKTDPDDNTNITWKVTAVDETTATIQNVSGSAYTVAGNPVICLAGAISTTGNILIPVGLAAWLPKTVAKGENFFGVDRSVARNRLAGSHIVATTGEKKYKTIQRAIAAVRKFGSKCDMIIMNDEDFLDMSAEIEDKTTFMKVDGNKAGTTAQLGYDTFGFSVIKNYLDQIVADPYCPKGTAYVIDSNYLHNWAFNNSDKVMKDGIGEQPGKPAVASPYGDMPNRPHQLLVDEIFHISDGEDTEDGSASIVSIQTYPQFVITNPCYCASIEFEAA